MAPMASTQIYNQKLFIYYYLYANILRAKSLVFFMQKKTLERDLTFFYPQRKNGLRLAPTTNQTPAQVEQDEA